MFTPNGFPTDAPDALRDIAIAADSLGGVVFVTDSDDRIATANRACHASYPFFDLATGGTFSDLYWAILEHGLADARLLRQDPAAYLAITQGARQTCEWFDFVKSYYRPDGSTARLLCHHRRTPGGWTVQVRMDLSHPLLRGHLGANMSDALTCATRDARFQDALGRLAIGVMLVDRRLRLIWRNPAAADTLPALDDMPIALGGALAEAVIEALDHGRTRYLTHGDPDAPRLLSVAPGVFPGEALILGSPTTDPNQSRGTVNDALASLGLTPAERHVALAVGTSDGPAQIAAATGRATGTVRRHLAEVFGKLGPNMGITSQRALARLIGQVVSIAGYPRHLRPTIINDRDTRHEDC